MQKSPARWPGLFVVERVAQFLVCRRARPRSSRPRPSSASVPGSGTEIVTSVPDGESKSCASLHSVVARSVPLPARVLPLRRSAIRRSPRGISIREGKHLTAMSYALDSATKSSTHGPIQRKGILGCGGHCGLRDGRCHAGAWLPGRFVKRASRAVVSACLWPGTLGVPVRPTSKSRLIRGSAGLFLSRAPPLCATCAIRSP